MSNPTQRRQAIEPRTPRHVLAEGTQPYGIEPPPEENETARVAAVVAPERPASTAGRYSHVYGRERR